MGVNAVALESYTTDTSYSRTAEKKQGDPFKTLIDVAAKKQSTEIKDTEADNATKSNGNTKKDKKVKDDVKETEKEVNGDNEKGEVFENEKNSYLNQAYLSRNAVDVVNMEIEPVQDVVSTAATEVTEVVPKTTVPVLTEMGQDTAVQATASGAGEAVVNKTSAIKNGEVHVDAKSDVLQDGKTVFKLADEQSKGVNDATKTDVHEANLRAVTKAEGENDATVQKAVPQVSIKENEDDIKKDISEATTGAQIATTQEKDVVVIKVADPVTSATGTELAEKLGNEIVVKIDKGADEFQAVLNPKGLGEIAVKLSAESGKVVVSMVCSNEATKTLLENNVSSLVKIVEGNMGQETVVNIYNDKQNTQENFDGQGNRGQYQGNSQQNKSDRDEEDSDFIQKLRLGIIGAEMEGV